MSRYPDQHANGLVICSTYNCPFPSKTNGLCVKHYNLWYSRYGRKKKTTSREVGPVQRITSLDETLVTCHACGQGGIVTTLIGEFWCPCGAITPFERSDAHAARNNNDPLSERYLICPVLRKEKE